MISIAEQSFLGRLPFLKGREQVVDEYTAYKDGCVSSLLKKDQSEDRAHRQSTQLSPSIEDLEKGFEGTKYNVSQIDSPPFHVPGKKLEHVIFVQTPEEQTPEQILIFSEIELLKKPNPAIFTKGKIPPEAIREAVEIYCNKRREMRGEILGRYSDKKLK